MYLYNILKEEWKQCLGLQPTAPPGPGGIHTAHAYSLLIGCLSYMLLFNLTGVDKALQRTKRMCRIIMAIKKLRILSHTWVWWIKDRAYILGYTFMLSSNYYYYQNHVRRNIWRKGYNLVHCENINDCGNKKGKIKDSLWNEALLNLILVFHVQFFPDPFMLITEIIVKNKWMVPTQRASGSPWFT